MTIYNKKRGLSPIIATTLLILIAVIIAVIILLWIRSYIGERAQKDLGGGAVALESVCKEIKFDADAKLVSGNLEVYIGNKGNAPIYGVEVKKKGIASISSLGTAQTSHLNLAITSGEDETLTVKSVSEKINKGDDLIIAPILLGENKNSKRAYVCEEQYGVNVEVS